MEAVTGRHDNDAPPNKKVCDLAKKIARPRGPGDKRSGA